MFGRYETRAHDLLQQRFFGRRQFFVVFAGGRVAVQRRDVHFAVQACAGQLMVKTKLTKTESVKKRRESVAGRTRVVDRELTANGVETRERLLTFLVMESMTEIKREHKPRSLKKLKRKPKSERSRNVRLVGTESRMSMDAGTLR